MFESCESYQNYLHNISIILISDFVKNVYLKIQNQRSLYQKTNYTARIRANKSHKTLVKCRYVTSMYEKLKAELITPLEFVENFYDYHYEENIKINSKMYDDEEIGLEQLLTNDHRFDITTRKFDCSFIKKMIFLSCFVYHF